jgi:hypothetical protein
MIEKDTILNHFLESRSFEKENPSNELVIKLKEIPLKYERNLGSTMNWILLLAAACFIGFMAVNLHHLNQTNEEKNPFETHLTNYNYYSL